MSSLIDSIVGSYDPDSISNKSLMESNFEKFTRIEYNQVFRFKIIPNPMYKDANGDRLRAVIYQQYWYTAEGAGGKIQRLPRPSLRLSGLDRDPQEDAITKVREAMKAIDVKAVKSPQDESTFAQLEKILKLLKPVTRAVILVVQPGGNQIVPLEIPVTVADDLFGKTAYGNKPAKAGLIAEMRTNGRNPYDIKSPTGWIEISKTGTNQYDTEYTVREAMESKQVVMNGTTIMANVPLSANVSDALFSVKEVPDVIKIANQNPWTAEEVTDFLSNDPNKKLKPPARITERLRSKRSESNDDREPQGLTAQTFTQATPVAQQVNPVAQAVPVAQQVNPVVQNANTGVFDMSDLESAIFG
jgi:hypothetical protein